MEKTAKYQMAAPVKDTGPRTASGATVKIHLDMTGQPLGGPDFAMLRAGLRAAQASTPTAAASDRAYARLDLAEALTRLFGDQVIDAPEAAGLHGRFHPAPAHHADDEGR